MNLSGAVLPSVAALLFGAGGALAAAPFVVLLGGFADEVGIARSLLIAVPGLFAMLFALLVYQGAIESVHKIDQALRRALLVALLTWAGFSAFATVIWSQPRNYLDTFGNSLLITGLIGGAPMLLVTLGAGYLVGRLILDYRAGDGSARDD